MRALNQEFRHEDYVRRNSIGRILLMATLQIATPTIILIVTVLLSTTRPARAADNIDKLMEACSRGDERACLKVEQIAEQNKVQIEKLNRQASAFQSRSKELGIQVGRIPDLSKAYPLAIKDYFASDAIGPSHLKRGWNEQLLASCSRHFHEFWINQRKEWPTDQSGRPDWATIYLQILDHYFSYCSR